MLKINKKSAIILAYAGALFSLAALLIFTILPTSELANGLQYSGTTALWVLALAPVFAICGAVCFMSSFLKDYKMWKNILSKEILCGATVMSAVFFIINIALILTYFINQLKLGFVAPYTGTKYEFYEIYIVAMTINQFLLATFATIGIIRNK